MDDEQERVWQFIVEMNRLWTREGRPEALVDYFHKDMVAITPTSRKRIEGGEACLADWKHFCENADIHHWSESEPLIHVYGEGRFAIVTYYFDMSFAMGGQTIEMKGRDMLTLVRENGKWLVVADQFSQMPAM